MTGRAPDAVFVYGTLRPGESRWSALASFAAAAEEATVGGQVYDTGAGYPAAVFGDGLGIVAGWRVRLLDGRSDEALGVLDEIEGEGTLFARVVVATSAGSAFAYEWLGPEAQILAAFEAYERDLLANDLEALDAWFADDAGVVRVAFSDVQYGAAEVARARRAVPFQTAPRRVERLEIRTWGSDVGGAFATCRLDGTGEVIHQTQVWVRRDGRWRIAAAHVSLA